MKIGKFYANMDMSICFRGGHREKKNCNSATLVGGTHARSIGNNSFLLVSYSIPGAMERKEQRGNDTSSVAIA